MKYIIIGLGNFGSSLGSMLSDMGHEVIGVDSEMQKVEANKDFMTNTICIDCSDMNAISSLPLKEADVVVVGIGEDFGASVMVTAMVKQKNVKRLICRAVSPLHESVFQALEVDEIVHPEQEAAERLVKRLINPGVVDSYQIGDEHLLIEIKAPERYFGTTVMEVDFKGRYKLNLITIIKYREGHNLFGKRYHLGHASDFVLPSQVIEENDILVFYGKRSYIDQFLGN